MADEPIAQAPPANSGDTLITDPAQLQAPPAQADPPANADPQDPPANADPQDPPKPPEGAPEKYEFKPPEGQEFDPKFLSAYSEVAKELNLSQENAQKLIDKVGPVLAAQQIERIEAIRTDWANQSKADKEFGGEKLQENLGIAKQALDKFGTPELKELINASGLGNHPELIRFFYRTGKAVLPDTFVGGHKDGGKVGPKTFNDIADALYGEPGK